MLVLAGLWVVAFGAFNPEGFVASRNLDQRTASGLDSRYLVDRLGSDAVPGIVERIPAQTPAVQAELTEALCANYSRHLNIELAGWNRSLSQAEAALHTLECQTS